MLLRQVPLGRSPLVRKYGRPGVVHLSILATLHRMSILSLTYSGYTFWVMYVFLHYGVVRLGLAQPVQIRVLVRMEPDINCFISDFTADKALSPHALKPSFIDSCVITAATTSGSA